MTVVDLTPEELERLRTKKPEAFTLDEIVEEVQPPKENGASDYFYDV